LGHLYKITNFLRDPTFQALYGSQFEAAKQALRENQIRLFGDPSKVQLTGVSRADAAAQARATEKSVARQVRSLDQQIADAYQGQSIDPTTFGTRVETLLGQKEKAARESTKPLYKEAFDLAAKNNVVLPATAVDDIYSFVTSETNRDIFNKFPTLYGLVEKRFRPKTTEPSAILTAEGKPATPGGVQFSDVSPEALDSLKRRINADLRSTNNTDQIRFLTMLKEKVSGHIDNLDPDFVNAYRNADNTYLQRVGLPYSSETIKNVDRKKFVEQIAPALIGNRTNVDDLIRATGAEGERLARDAFYDSFTTAAASRVSGSILFLHVVWLYYGYRGLGHRAAIRAFRCAGHDISRCLAYPIKAIFLTYFNRCVDFLGVKRACSVFPAVIVPFRAYAPHPAQR